MINEKKKYKGGQIEYFIQNQFTFYFELKQSNLNSKVN